MTLRHYEQAAADCPRFSPGWSFTADISEDMDFPECLAALECEGRGAGCDHDEPCDCRAATETQLRWRAAVKELWRFRGSTYNLGALLRDVESASVDLN